MDGNRVEVHPKASGSTDLLIQKIKSEIVIENYIGNRVQLKRSGTNHVGKCPFHSPDRNPSLTVYPATGSYHCYGC